MTGIGSHSYQKENGFPQRQSLKEVIELGKKAIDWDRKWHAPGAGKLPNGRMHGLGFVHINEWSWMAGRQFGCLILREGKVHIIGERADFGMDTESAFRQCVAAEAGLRYEDTVIQVQRSDAQRLSVLGSRRIHGDRPDHSAARACRAGAEEENPQLRRAAASGGHDDADDGHTPAHVSREKDRRSGCQGRLCFREGESRQQKNREGGGECLLGRGSGDHSSGRPGRNGIDLRTGNRIRRCIS